MPDGAGMRRHQLIAAATLTLGLALVATVSSGPPAAAEERTCRGRIGRTTVDNVRVPPGATCTLAGTRLIGTVKIERGATLHALGARINGNVQGEGAAFVRVAQGSRVGGSYQVVQGGRATLLDSVVQGQVLVDENRRRINIRRNVVGDSIQAFQNRGGVAIFRNLVDGNLQCKENRPAPTGGGNRVQGNKEDQCRRF